MLLLFRHFVHRNRQALHRRLEQKGNLGKQNFPRRNGCYLHHESAIGKLTLEDASQDFEHALVSFSEVENFSRRSCRIFRTCLVACLSGRQGRQVGYGHFARKLRYFSFRFTGESLSKKRLPGHLIPHSLAPQLSAKSSLTRHIEPVKVHEHYGLRLLGGFLKTSDYFLFF